MNFLSIKKKSTRKTVAKLSALLAVMGTASAVVAACGSSNNNTNEGGTTTVLRNANITGISIDHSTITSFVEDNKPTFFLNDGINLGTGRVQVMLEDGTTRTNTLSGAKVFIANGGTNEEIDVTSHKFTQLGDQTLVFHYFDFTEEVPITVLEKTVINIVLAKEPRISPKMLGRIGPDIKSTVGIPRSVEKNAAKTDIDEIFNFDNAKNDELIIFYNNGTFEKRPITPEMFSAQFMDISNIGDFEIDISYGGKTTGFTLSIFDEVGSTTQLVERIAEVSPSSSAQQIEAIATSNAERVAEKIDAAITSAIAQNKGTDAPITILLPGGLYDFTDIKTKLNTKDLVEANGIPSVNFDGDKYGNNANLLIARNNVSLVGIDPDNQPVFYSKKSTSTQWNNWAHQSTVIIGGDNVTLKNVVIRGRQRAATGDASIMAKAIEVVGNNAKIINSTIDGKSPGERPDTFLPSEAMTTPVDPADINTAVYIGASRKNSSGKLIPIDAFEFSGSTIQDGYFNIAALADKSEADYKGVGYDMSSKSSTLNITRNTFINAAISLKGEDINRGWLVKDIETGPNVSGNTFKSPFIHKVVLNRNVESNDSTEINYPTVTRAELNRAAPEFDGAGFYLRTSSSATMTSDAPNNLRYVGYIQSFALNNSFSKGLTISHVLPTRYLGNITEGADPIYNGNTLSLKLATDKKTYQILDSDLVTVAGTVDFNNVTLIDPSNDGSTEITLGKLKRFARNFYFH